MLPLPDPIRLPLDLPTSSRLRAIGKRLVADIATEEDLQAFGDYLRTADDLQDAVVGVLNASALAHFTEMTEGIHKFYPAPRSSSLYIRGRAKSENTLIAKLRQRPTFHLGKIRDVAGVRVVMDCTLLDQDQLVAAVIRVLESALGDGAPRRIDRRIEPMSGYRAIHLEFRAGQMPVEVQIRTHLQHVWAELFERMADVAGRQIRYGDPPFEPWGPMVDTAMQISKHIRQLEELDALPHEEGFARLREQAPPSVWGQLKAATGVDLADGDLAARRALLDDVRQDVLSLLQSLTDWTEQQTSELGGAPR